MISFNKSCINLSFQKQVFKIKMLTPSIAQQQQNIYVNNMVAWKKNYTIITIIKLIL